MFGQRSALKHLIIHTFRVAQYALSARTQQCDPVSAKRKALRTKLGWPRGAKRFMTGA
jgi:hypothetical protein